MISRRRFLSTGLVGAGLAGTSGLAAASMGRHREAAVETNTFDEVWARANLERFGIPKSWWHVHCGLHPFSPERVLVIGHRPEVWRFRALKTRLLEQGDGTEGSLSDEQLDYAIWIMHVLTTCYGVPEYFEDWATNLADRDRLGLAFGSGDHWGLLHQFQWRGADQPVRTQNGLVDWWLVLIPHGVDFQRFDGRPIHALLGCVDANGDPMREMNCMCMVSELARSLKDVVALSRMDRLAAARHLNRQLVESPLALWLT
jgi:hypothetical protein